MKRLLIPVALASMALTACGQGGGGEQQQPADPGPARQAFDEQAQRIAQAWEGQEQPWTGDLVVLDRPVSVPTQDLTEAQSAALNAGWYELATSLPSQEPSGTVDLGDSEIAVSVWDAATAYENLAVGGEPPADCPTEPVPDETSGTDDDGTTSHTAVCGVLTITDMTATSTTVWSNRGAVKVPAWEYTAEGLSESIVQVAFDIAAPSTPTVDAGDAERPDGVVGAIGLDTLPTDELTVLLGVGACDEDIQVLVYEAPSAIVVAGTVTRDESQMCTEQLLLRPASAPLSAPIGDRMVIDAYSGSVLSVGTGGPIPA
ncbi:hypothetical protein FB566_0449 [Stackebrandtia endophytica]|uniref:Uncharacterized protein n=1 Tax=Stackebrandtia endophytica TaxID=1496996 RepID=A0A543AQU4_9ACTN|nr:hypothetical protein [Stackebrandtia endophytica]TQL74958.1 hypothetical protein FB566_0449 [Stackebrandtia endophytica]